MHIKTLPDKQFKNIETDSTVSKCQIINKKTTFNLLRMFKTFDHLQ